MTANGGPKRSLKYSSAADLYAIVTMLEGIAATSKVPDDAAVTMHWTAELVMGILALAVEFETSKRTPDGRVHAAAPVADQRW